MFVFSTNDDSFVCYHNGFVFVGTLKKAATNHASKFCSRDKPMFGPWTFLRNLQLVSYVIKLFSNQSFWCICNTFLVWHQPVVDPISIQSFENCVHKKPL